MAHRHKYYFSCYADNSGFYVGCEIGTCKLNIKMPKDEFENIKFLGAEEVRKQIASILGLKRSQS